MTQADDPTHEPPRRSASAEAFALRWGEGHPDEEVERVALAVPPPADGVPNRHSASAEAAALRPREQDEDAAAPRAQD